jgi:hypothetical protein
MCGYRVNVTGCTPHGIVDQHKRTALHSSKTAAACLPICLQLEKRTYFLKRRAIQSCKSRVVSKIGIPDMGYWDVHDSVRAGRSLCQVDGNASPPSNFQAKCTEITEDFST